MVITAPPLAQVLVAGVDTHLDTHHAAVVTLTGRVLADAAFPATSAGYRRLLHWIAADARAGVANAADSVVQYVAYRAARDDGRTEEADTILANIEQYNAYDCRSTLGLRDWLRGLPEVQGLSLDLEPVERPGTDFEPSALDLRLQQLGEEAEQHGRAAEGAAYRLAAAAIDFHRREQKSFWWSHFDRLEQPAEEWQETRNVLVAGANSTADAWDGVGPKGGAPKRDLTLRGLWSPGSSQPREGTDVFLVYGNPVPYRPPGHRAGQRVATRAKLLEAVADGAVRVQESLPAGAEPWSQLPSHLTPGSPPRAENLTSAIEAWGASIVEEAPNWPGDAMTRLLLRASPGGDHPLGPMAGPDDATRAVVASLTGAPQSYLAVQGPPGTGKTYLAAHVIAELVMKHHWAIGVTAQSHKVIENVLEAVIQDGGLSSGIVTKKRDKGGSNGSFTVLPDNGFRAFADRNASTGYVIGGTPWDMTNRTRVGERQLDLLVIDEAGQFSLANTIATAMSARRVLLLGDPQQLPQVTQGIHPAPVDGSALAHVLGAEAVLPEDFGYFLAESRRMDAALAAPVSRLSYEGQLRSHACTLARRLEGVKPGLHSAPVPHSGNATASPEEAAAVLAIVQRHLGLAWTPDDDKPPRPLEQIDVIIVTPYNAQVELLRRSLDAAGLTEVPVGTVDKFQGREAVVAIVSLGASDASEVPRGIDFLLSRNRLNVSISRAKWAAYLVHSPALMDHLPMTPAGLATLSRFITLVP